MDSKGSDVIIRQATVNDCSDIARLIKELADYEKLGHKSKLTPEDLERDGFGSEKYFRCLVAEDVAGQEIVGYAIYFNIYSTFIGRSLCLEDIYVTQKYRNFKIGLRLIQSVAKIAVEEGCKQIDFVVLSWNEPSIKFYKKLGATNLTETGDWHLYRINEGLKSLADLEL